MRNTQKHKLGCGPVAIFNASQWARKSISYNDIVKLSKSYGFSDKNGMGVPKIGKCLTKLNLKYHEKAGIKFSDILSQIDQGNAVLYSFWHDNGEKHPGPGGHITFIDQYKGRKIRAWNFGEKSPWIPKKKIISRIEYSNKDNRADHAFFIIKENRK